MGFIQRSSHSDNEAMNRREDCWSRGSGGEGTENRTPWSVHQNLLYCSLWVLMPFQLSFSWISEDLFCPNLWWALDQWRWLDLRGSVSQWYVILRTHRPEVIYSSWSIEISCRPAGLVSGSSSFYSEFICVYSFLAFTGELKQLELLVVVKGRFLCFLPLCQSCSVSVQLTKFGSFLYFRI